MLRPTYSFNEVRRLIRLSDCKVELDVIRFVIRDEEKRYTVYEFQYLRDLWTIKFARMDTL